MYATIDTNGRATGFYRDTKHAEKVGISPTDTLVEITKAQWRELLENPGTRRWDTDTGEVVAYTPPLPPLADYQIAARTAIDSAAGAARAAYPSPGSYIDIEYQHAERQAEEFKAAGYPADAVPACVQDWSDASGMTPTAAADDIMATAVEWYAAIESIRRERLMGKAAVNAALDHVGVDAARADATAALDAIRPTA
ncbi:hypothetical protein [Thiohalomonas denitrificans]|uniref:hypothetical protein n=1 Tax=Thiohalomonas denitrificans TaxID=415747 RepID=UPI0026EEB5FD|nr:hypothetical protein [Thiohalomonas denitrificans]